MDDRVRGGSSQSYLNPLKNGNPCKASARFHGVLDTKTLGGAGFASQSTSAVSSDNQTPEEPIWDLSSYDGLVLGIASADSKVYTITLKDDLPDSQRDDGRERSGISWEADFKLRRSDLIDYNFPDVLVARTGKENDSKYVMKIPWSAFRATYRGRDKPGELLQTTHIRRFGLMMRSFFERQDGMFEQRIDYIDAYHTKSTEGDTGENN